MQTNAEPTDDLLVAQYAALARAHEITVQNLRRLFELRDEGPDAGGAVRRLSRPLTAQFGAYWEVWESLAKSFTERLADAAQCGINAPHPPPRSYKSETSPPVTACDGLTASTRW